MKQEGQLSDTALTGPRFHENSCLALARSVLWLALAGTGCTGYIEGPAPASGPSVAAAANDAPSSPAGQGGIAGNGDVALPPQPDPFEPPLPFEALEPAAGAAKVKKLMTGLPLDEDERAAVAANPSALPALVDAWMALPEWRQRLLFFFEQAFQQTQTDVDSYIDQIYHGVHGVWEDRQRMIENAEESFARTALGLVDEGRPFTEVVTTRRFMMTTGLLHTIAYIDTMPRNDLGGDAGDFAWFLRKYPGYTYRTFKGATALYAESSWMHGGNIFGGGSSVSTEFRDQDWKDWRWVTFRQPKNLAETTDFNDLPALRSAKEAVLYAPRVGFFTTPAFFANWNSNIDNGSRVLANQTLIVALDRSIDGENTTIALDDSNVEKLHAEPGTVCYGCHVTLDPLRDFFRLSYGYYGHPRSAPPPSQDAFPTSARFSLNGSAPVVGTTLYELGDALAAHPAFAPAWTQKLCKFANSELCDNDDPEFQRIAGVFAQSGFQFPTLVRELFSSPLVTQQARTASAEKFGVIISIARQSALCQALEVRTKVPDLCGLRGKSELSSQRLRDQAANLALTVPGDAYARGEEKPLMPRDPNLFFFSAVENLCALLASEVVESETHSLYRVSEKDAALHEFVSTIMGVPAGDARFGDVLQVLVDHHAAALDSGASPVEALRATFVLACESPLTISLGL